MRESQQLQQRNSQKLNNLIIGLTTGRRNGPGRLDSRRTATRRTAYGTHNLRLSQGTHRGALFPLGYEHAARRKRAQAHESDQTAKSDVLQVIEF
jgi:hypothetical protein